MSMPTEKDHLLGVRKDNEDELVSTSSHSSGSVGSSERRDDLGELQSNKHNEDDEDDNHSAIGSVMTTLNDAVVEMAGDVQEAIVEFVENTQEAVVDEVHQVADTIMDELHDADDGNLYFFDMCLTRNLSILPSDMVDAAEARAQANEANDQNNDGDESDEETGIFVKKIEQDNTPSTSTTLSAYILLGVAVISLSSIGPLLQFQGEEVSPTMKIQWRMMGTAFILSPFMLNDVRKGLPRLSRAQWITFLLATLSYTTMGVAFVIALSYTSVGNAVILGNSLAIILLVGKICVGNPVSLVEGSGAIIAFLGAALCSKDTDEGGSEGSNTILGDALALLSAVGGVGYLVFAGTVRPHLTISCFTWMTMAVGCAMCLLFQVVVLEETVTYDTDRSTGLFGFLSLDSDRLPLELTMVVICNCLGTMGYVRAMAHFNNLIISVAGLLEPVCALFIALGLGVGVLPGWKGWLGNLLVALGTYAVVYPSSKSGKGSAAH